MNMHDFYASKSAMTGNRRVPASMDKLWGGCVERIDAGNQHIKSVALARLCDDYMRVIKVLTSN